MHAGVQESLVREIPTVSAAGKGWHQAELLILKMCCLEAGKHSEAYVTFSPLEIQCIKYLPVSWYRQFMNTCRIAERAALPLGPVPAPIHKLLIPPLSLYILSFAFMTKLW